MMDILVMQDENKNLLICDGDDEDHWEIHIPPRQVPGVLDFLRQYTLCTPITFNLRSKHPVHSLKVVNTLGHVRFNQGATELIVPKHHVEELIDDIERLIKDE